MKKEDNKNKTKEIKKSLLTILLFFIFPYVFQISLFYPLTHTNNIIKSIILLCGEFILTGILIFLYKDRFKGAVEDLKKNKKEYLDLMFKYWILGFIIMTVSNLFINIVLQNGIADNEASNRAMMTSLAIYAIPAITILGPICEEITFRGALKNVINNEKIYVITTSLLFASAHLLNNISSLIDLLYIIPYGSLGVAMGYVYCKTDNILTNIIMHIFHNSLAVLAILSTL